MVAAEEVDAGRVEDLQEKQQTQHLDRVRPAIHIVAQENETLGIFWAKMDLKKISDIEKLADE